MFSFAAYACFLWSSALSTIAYVERADWTSALWAALIIGVTGTVVSQCTAATAVVLSVLIVVCAVATTWLHVTVERGKTAKRATAASAIVYAGAAAGFALAEGAYVAAGMNLAPVVAAGLMMRSK